MASPNTPGDLGGLSIYLSPWSPPEDRYQRRYVPVQPSSQTIQGTNDQIAPDTTIAEWHIDDWTAGRGYETWRPGDDGYWKGDLIPDSWSGALLGGGPSLVDATGIHRFGFINDGQVYGVSDDDIEYLNGAIWASIGVNPTGSPRSACAGFADKISYVANDETIFKVDSSAPSETSWYGGFGATDYMTLAKWAGPTPGVFVLVKNSLYEVDTTTQFTAPTIREDLSNINSDDYFATNSGQEKYNRLTMNDVGPVWWVRADNGVTNIWQYNVADDAASIIGTLPVQFAIPFDIHFAQGFVWVAFRASGTYDEVSPGYLYAFQGGQESVIGPFANLDGDDKDGSMTIGGFIGDRLYVTAGNKGYLYDVSDGAILEYGSTSAKQLRNSIVQGPLLYQFGNLGAGIGAAYSTTLDAGGFVNTGWYDFGYRGLNKIFLDVSVTIDREMVTGTNPDQEEINLRYRVDDGSWSAWDTWGPGEGTTKKWVLSDSTTTVKGKKIQLEVSMDTLNTGDEGPTILSITSRAVGAESRIEWVLNLDASTSTLQTGYQFLADLKALQVAHNVVRFCDPWQVRDSDGPEGYDVTIEEVYTPLEQDDGNLTVQVRLRSVETDPVAASCADPEQVD